LVLSKEELVSILDISPPFLMVDEITHVDPGQLATSRREVRPDDWFMSCHLMSAPVMPGALLTELMLQTLMVPIYLAGYHHDKGIVTKFEVQLKRKIDLQITPVRLTTTAKILSHRRGITRGEVNVHCGESTVASSTVEHVIPALMLRPSLGSASPDM
jgi:3-hydroxymyristoyl/3-hydroxydecanoyl-(acyl carrier protein) dehydratase